MGDSDRPRVVFFGSSSPFSRAAVESLCGISEIAAVVVPSVRLGWRTWRGWRGFRKGNAALVRLARARGIPVLEVAPGEQEGLARRLRARGDVDLFAVAAFPRRLTARLLQIPRLGGLNLHPSLLPAHRGATPLFWSYFGNDDETGVTVHVVDAELDTGGIVVQERVPLPRGTPLASLRAELAARGAALLAQSVAAVHQGRAQPRPQDEGHATSEPAAHLDTRWRQALRDWPAERLWHFLCGVGDEIGALTRHGAPLAHGRALAYSAGTHDRAPGEIDDVASGWRVYCIDGHVDVARRS